MDIVLNIFAIFAVVLLCVSTAYVRSLGKNKSIAVKGYIVLAGVLMFVLWRAGVI